MPRGHPVRGPRFGLRRRRSTSRVQNVIRQTQRPKCVRAFKSHDEMIESARQMFAARERLMETSSDDELDAAARDVTGWDQFWHAAFEKSRRNAICKRCLNAKLTPVEREIVMTLLLSRLGLGAQDVSTTSEILRSLHLDGRALVEGLRSMSEYGPLVKLGFVYCQNPDESPGEQVMAIDPALVDAVIHEGLLTTPGWPVKTEEDLHRHLQRLTRALVEKQSALGVLATGFGDQSEAQKWCRKVDNHFAAFQQTIALHPEWRIHAALPPEGKEASLVILALLAKELGHLGAECPLFAAGGLAHAMVDKAEEIQGAMARFTEMARTTLKERIQPCGGMGELLTDDPKAMEDVEFELTPGAIKDAGIEKRIVKTRHGRTRVREANTRLEQLVLTPRTRQALDTAIAHARHSERLIKDWGIGEIIPYGRGVTLLFSGPPGTGKTASAEGLAHALTKPILVADYSQIQNCYVGQTEKNIAKAFREARANDAVLFWDEADAMLGSRESSSHNWEVRDVNVLLQELERFEGVCVLATNRKGVLDPALERRITLKVEFERPSRAMRVGIWTKLVPAKLPLAADVDMDRLSEADLSGGEIKNVVLNAARLALQRSATGPVTQDDFQKALVLEREGRWNEASAGRIGFHS